MFDVKGQFYPIWLSSVLCNESLLVLFLFVILFPLLYPSRCVPSFLYYLVTGLSGLVSNLLVENGLSSSSYIWVCTLMSFLVFVNMIGSIPFSYSLTSQFFVGIGKSFLVKLSIWFRGFVAHGVSYFSSFKPSGGPVVMSPLLVSIELISNLSRSVSLGLRLSANLTSGHLMIGVLSSFVSSYLVYGFPFGLFPIIFVFMKNVLELFVAIIQSYVFVLLYVVYLSEAVNLH